MGESGERQLVLPKHQGYSRARATAELEDCHVKVAQERAAVLQQIDVLRSAVHSSPIEWEASVLMRIERECDSALSSLGILDPFADSIPSMLEFSVDALLSRMCSPCTLTLNSMFAEYTFAFPHSRNRCLVKTSKNRTA